MQNENSFGELKHPIIIEEDNRDLTKVSEDKVDEMVELFEEEYFLPQAVGSKLIVKPDEAETVSKGGVVIPDMSQEVPRRGLVMSIGKGHYTATGTIMSMTVKVGDTVIYPKYGAAIFEYDDIEYVVVEEKDLLAILPKK